MLYPLSYGGRARPPGHAGSQCNGGCGAHCAGPGMMGKVSTPVKTFAAVAVAAALLTAVSACSSDSGGAADTAADGPTVLVQDQRYIPAEITIAPGETVTWIFDDSGTAHDVTSVTESKKDPKLLDSGLLVTGEWSFTFDQPGVYEYFCDAHPEMEGTVVVAE